MYYKTEQEKFWIEKEWADSYMERKSFEKIDIVPYENFFSRIITNNCKDIRSVLEFGANIGLNLVAMNNLYPEIEYSGIELNKNACEKLNSLTFIKNVYNQSIIELDVDKKSDLVLIKTVLIHINPNYLDAVYTNLYEMSNRYILVAEYYNPTPIEVHYRGHTDKLFKRDFAGELLDRYDDLKLIDYGFAYHRDKTFEQDDVTWFLLEKINN